MIDLDTFRRNQSRFPREQLEKVNGQYVAWSLDGTAILASDPDPIRLDEAIRAAGHNPAEILVTRIALPEDVSWNGWCVSDAAPT